MDFAAFDSFVDETLKTWLVPGTAIAVVKDDQIVLNRGYGLRDVQQNLPVNENTVFGIASMTKAFTTAAMGILVDRGLLEWDRPVREYMPEFKLFNGEATALMTARDLVSHRSGLPRHDLLWYLSPFAREELMSRLCYLEPNRSFRSEYQYQNLMFTAAGYLIEKITHQTWEQFVRKEIFEPLGMARSDVAIKALETWENTARPYQKKDQQAALMPLANVDPLGPAGSINSCVNDLTQWLRLHLNGGTVDGKQIISSAALAEMYRPNIRINRSTIKDFTYDEVDHYAYGMGWFLNTYRGKRWIHHGGNIDGYSTRISILPEENMGLVVLTNLNENCLPSVFTLQLLDILLGAEPLPWREKIGAEVKRFEQAGEQLKERVKRKQKGGTSPSHPLAEYCGDFSHPAYGTISIGLKDGSLCGHFNNIQMDLKHYHYDVFEAANEDLGMKMRAAFSTDLDGNICGFSVPLEPNVKEIYFEKAPEKHLSSKASLSRLVGEYDLFGKKARVVLQGKSALTLELPGEIPCELIPYREMEFKVKNNYAMRVEFLTGGQGKVESLEVSHSEGVFTAKKLN